MDIELVTNPYGISASPLDREDADDLSGLLVRGAWSPEIATYMAGHNIQALYLNHARGWRGGDYSFLREVPWLRLLNIITPPSDDLTPVGDLHALEKLSISCHTKRRVDFASLQSLKSCFLSWWSGARSIFQCTKLEKLYLDTVKEADLEGLSNLQNLRKLTIGNSNISSLAPLAGLRNLEKLELLNCTKLASLDGLERFSNLGWLAIDGSNKIHDFSRLAHLPNLEVLNLSESGKIQSLEPLRRLTKLRAFAFAGATTVVEDGDLSPLEDLPQLSMLMFGPRKHYTHQLVKSWSWANFYQPDRLLKKKSANKSLEPTRKRGAAQVRR